MAKTRKRPGTTQGGAQAQMNRPESPQVRQDAPTNGHAERVAARAYELYLARGGSHGSDWEDWLAAEREIVGTLAHSEDR